MIAVLFFIEASVLLSTLVSSGFSARSKFVPKWSLECEVSVVGGGWNDSALQGYVYMAMSLLPPTFPRATLIKVG